MKRIFNTILVLILTQLVCFTYSGHDESKNLQYNSTLDKWQPEKIVDVQNPLPTDGYRVFAKDVWVDESVTTDWTDTDSAGIDIALIPFTNLHTRITNATSDNPKTLTIHFNESTITNVAGLGCAGSGNFSNVKIEAINSGEIATTVYDNSSDDTKHTSQTVSFPATFGANALRFTFHTTDEVCISNIYIPKTTGVVARLQATKPDNTVTDINATTGGNLKVSMEELESDISVNSNTQLKVTNFTSSGDEGVTIVDSQTGKQTNVESLGSLKTITPTRLCGTAFSNGTKDTNFWDEVVTGTGSVTQSGEIILATGTTADSTAQYTTVRRARKVTGRANQFRAIARNVQEPTADCIRRVGAYCDDDGFFMQYDGTTFGVGARKGGVDTVVTNGNFNGNLGATIDVLDTNFIRLIIEYTSLSAKFFVNGYLIHTISATTSSLTETQDLKARIEIINENGNTTNNSYEVLFATIVALGDIITESANVFISTNATTVCKYGAGRLRRILNVDNAGSITIYDNTAASGTVIATIDTAKALGTLDFDIPFNEGLTVVTATGAKVVVVYE